MIVLLKNEPPHYRHYQNSNKWFAKMPRGISYRILIYARCYGVALFRKKHLFLTPRFKPIATPFVTFFPPSKGMKPKQRFVQYPGVSLCRRIPFPLAETPAFKDVYKEGNPDRDHLTTWNLQSFNEGWEREKKLATCLTTLWSFKWSTVLQPV